MRVTRAKPPKPVGFFWRDADGFELRMSVATEGGGKRKQPYIGGMALSTWQKHYDKYQTDADRLDALAEWIAAKLEQKGLQPPTAD